MPAVLLSALSEAVAAPPPPSQAPREAPLPPLRQPPAVAAVSPAPLPAATQAAVPVGQGASAAQAPIRGPSGMGAGVLGAPVSPQGLDAFAYRNDPNNIFTVLQNKMRQLELNQSLIHDWLTVWQSQIGTKVKALNVSSRAQQLNVSSLQASVAAVEAEQAAMNATVEELRRACGSLLQQASAAEASPASDAAEVEERMAELQRQSELRLLRELESSRLNQRVELACAVLLSLGVSWIIFAFCFAHEPPTIPVADRPIRIDRARSRVLMKSVSGFLSSTPRRTRRDSDAHAFECAVHAAVSELSGSDPLPENSGATPLPDSDSDGEASLDPSPRQLVPAPCSERKLDFRSRSWPLLPGADSKWPDSQAVDEV